MHRYLLISLLAAGCDTAQRPDNQEVAAPIDITAASQAVWDELGAPGVLPSFTWVEGDCLVVEGDGYPACTWSVYYFPANEVITVYKPSRLALIIAHELVHAALYLGDGELDFGHERAEWDIHGVRAGQEPGALVALAAEHM